MEFYNPEWVPLREWGVYRKVRDAAASGTYGDLCSLRWTWFSSAGAVDLLYTGVLAEIVAASRELAGGALTRLHIEPVTGIPACFALAAFEGGVVAEVEIHEALPHSAPAIRFLMADFSEGRVSNRPLVGHHHDEGAFLVTEGVTETLRFEPMPEVSKPLEDAFIQSAILTALEGRRL